MVDRRFNRVRYDADQTVAAFAARLQEGAALNAVRSDLLAVVTTAVEPASSSVGQSRRLNGHSALFPHPSLTACPANASAAGQLRVGDR